jgi:AcrR family transcriptional regulator
MTTREAIKQETRRKLLAAAKQEFIAAGLFDVSTLAIAQRAGVAHGTVFFHFQNKETLLIEVLDQELLRLTDELRLLLSGPSDLAALLNRYLDFLQREEDFFATLAQEMPRYPPPLRRTVLGREAAVRMYFYQAIENAIASGTCKPVEITTLLNFLFGTLNYYLSLRSSFAGEGSVIAEKRQTIVGTFIQLISI